ncbi:HoxN/HupN/NixA family nickel/cobalt transporter [Nocardia sp. NPDC052254]|uniref:HoxN/HupN/NixA family nickel/cobalt transporter n=1 Tax=Nocardia sp. NPDC052254 TaxID=3155681 RepID=UPI0034174FDF
MYDRAKQALRADLAPITLMAGSVLALHVIGFAMSAWVVSGHHSPGHGPVFGIGMAVTAYTLGVRHAFDADHIAAIDNTTRSLITRGTRPLTVGFWFSLGHSTVVFGMCALLAFGVRALNGQLGDESSTLRTVTGTFGTAVSATFLIVIGILNLLILIRLLRNARDLRAGATPAPASPGDLGVLTRLIGGLLGKVRGPGAMYPIGLLFGLGFDTASEIALLVLAGTAAVALPWYAILTLPILFTAGMALFDSLDGAFMYYAYEWSRDRPMRRLVYNISVTSISVAVALLVGGIELTGLLTERLHIGAGPLARIGSIDLEYVGYAMVAVLAAIILAPPAMRWTRHRPRESGTQH